MPTIPDHRVPAYLLPPMRDPDPWHHEVLRNPKESQACAQENSSCQALRVSSALSGDVFQTNLMPVPRKQWNGLVFLSEGYSRSATSSCSLCFPFFGTHHLQSRPTTWSLLPDAPAPPFLGSLPGDLLCVLCLHANQHHPPTLERFGPYSALGPPSRRLPTFPLGAVKSLASLCQ